MFVVEVSWWDVNMTSRQFLSRSFPPLCDGGEKIVFHFWNPFSSFTFVQLFVSCKFLPIHATDMSTKRIHG